MSSIQLEDIIKNNLANYEARYDANDWNRMENLLGTTPDSSPFNWKPVLITFIVLIVLGGGYALYTTIDFSKPAEKPVTVPYIPPPVVKKTVTPPAKKENPPAPVTPQPVINQDSVRQAEEDARIAQEEEDRKTKLEAEREEARAKKERKREEPTKEELEAREARKARRKALADSNKTDSRENVKEEVKKEKAKSSSSFGLNIFSTLNADSLKKFQERSSKKDSVK